MAELKAFLSLSTPVIFYVCPVKRCVVSLGTVSCIDHGVNHSETAVMISALLVKNEIVSRPWLIFITPLSLSPPLFSHSHFLSPHFLYMTFPPYLPLLLPTSIFHCSLSEVSHCVIYCKTHNTYNKSHFFILL